MKQPPRQVRDAMRPEYTIDYSKAERGKYQRRIVETGRNVVVLDPDVFEVFKDSRSVNEALRAVLAFASATNRLTARRSRGRRSGSTAEG